MERRISLQLVLSVLVGVAVVAYLGMILWLSSKKPDSSTQEGSMQVVEATVKITLVAAQEVEISFSSKQAPQDSDDVILVFPSGTPEDTFTIRISSRELNTLSESGIPGWQHLNVINIEIVDKDNALIDAPVDVCFILNDENWNQLITNPNSYRVEYFDENITPASWAPLAQTIMNERHMICGQATQLSLFALSTNNANQIIPITGATNEPYRP
jgi:hypothetical protein